MSEPVSKAEIEDVLSSIRRLVSENAGAIRRDKDKGDEADSQRLVLTPAFRVDEEAAEPADEDEAVAEAELDEVTPDEPEAVAEVVEVEAEAVADDTDGAGEAEPVADHEAPAAEAMAETTTEERLLSPLEQRIAELEAVVARSAAEFEPDGSEPEDLPETFVFRHAIADDDEAEAEVSDLSEDVAPDEREAELAEAAEPEAWEAEAAEPEAMPEPELDEWEPEADAAPEEEAAEVQTDDVSDDLDADDDVEAGFGEADDAGEPDEFALEAETDEDEAAELAALDGLESAPEPFTLRSVPNADDDAALDEAADPEPAPEAQAWDEADDEPDDVMDATSYDDVAADDAGLATADEDEWEDVAEDAAPQTDETIIDEEALREMVSRMVREELQGSVGERITHNVRRMVRREIARALSLQDID